MPAFTGTDSLPLPTPKDNQLAPGHGQKPSGDFCHYFPTGLFPYKILETQSVASTQPHRHELSGVSGDQNAAKPPFSGIWITGLSLAPVGTLTPPLAGAPLGWFPRLGMFFEFLAGLPGGFGSVVSSWQVVTFPGYQRHADKFQCNSNL